MLTRNVEYACEHIRNHYEGVQVSRPSGHIYAFPGLQRVVFRTWKDDSGSFEIRLGCGVAWQDGAMFGGPCHIRMNLALPFSLVQEAFARLDQYVF